MVNLKNKYRIPMKSGQPGYFNMWQRCKHFGKPWDELTEGEKTEDLSKRGKKHAVKYDPTPKDGPTAYKSKCCGGCRFEGEDCQIRNSVKGEHSCRFKQATEDQIPPESREDLFFLADALKMAADEMRDLNATLRKLIAEAECARESPQE